MKKIMAMGLCASMILTMAACGKNDGPEIAIPSNDKTETTTEATVKELKTSDFEYKALDYVTLGDYKGLEVTVTPSMDYEYSDEGFAEYVNNNIIAASDAAYYRDDEITEVAENSIVNVDYTGYLDGEAFQGGAATDVMLDIANNCTPGGSGYIDGFSSGLVGAKVGETVDCDVTFPENYGATDLAGKAVIFRFKVNYICRVTTFDNLTDEVVSKYFGHDTVEAFKESAKEGYEEFRNQAKDSDLQGEVSQAVFAGATVADLPEALINARVEDTIQILMKRYGATSEAQLDAMWAQDANMQGATVADYREYLKNRIPRSLQSEMVFMAIYEQEGMGLSEEEFNDYVTRLAGDNTTKEDLITSYGSTQEIGELYLRQLAMINKAVQFCADNAKVTYAEAAAE